MDLAKYEELTGNTVPASEQGRVNATIVRANALLESLLGYSLSSSQNIDKTEIGKVQFEGGIPLYPVNTGELLPPDTAVGTYRLFYYNDKDLYLKSDPTRNIYHVKLVQALNDDQFVTIVDLEDFTAKRYGKFGKFIQRSTGWFNWNWYGWLINRLGNGNGLMVAVDAEWLNEDNMPQDLAFLWADMVAYYSDENYSVSGSLKSESVTGHSWSRNTAGGGKGVDLSPEQSDAGMKTLSQYVGPNGTLAFRNRA